VSLSRPLESRPSPLSLSLHRHTPLPHRHCLPRLLLHSIDLPASPPCQSFEFSCSQASSFPDSSAEGIRQVRRLPRVPSLTRLPRRIAGFPRTIKPCAGDGLLGQDTTAGGRHTGRMDQGLRCSSPRKLRFWRVLEVGRRRRGVHVAAPQRRGGIFLEYCC
jgi:hypothetical protein